MAEGAVGGGGRGAPRWRLLLAAGANVDARALLAGVREDGSWKSYARRPHRLILRLRSLYARGRATLARTQRRKPRGADARRDRAILFLVKLGDNGVLWNVLSFWRATD